MSLIEFHSPSGTLALFDPSVLKHRLLDPRGWWQDEQQALREMRHGQLAIVDLGLSGTYLARQLCESEFERCADEEFRPIVSFHLACPTGHLFVGRAESTTGDELEPDGDFGDIILSVPAGTQSVHVARSGEFDLLLNIERSHGKPSNQRDSLPTLALG